ncbi:MAG TPA: 5-oxoprolinase subunit PxpA [Ilumatobacteraceae bacterium]|nr:5-oxoprolinase subunit PxpA [Ilumatobacteraceae bacterium]
MQTIDLNSDLGEGFGPWAMGDDAAMLSVVSSANVACGGHAGDPETMYATCRTAAEHGVVIGAHPAYADREGFGRRIIPMRPDEIGRMVVAQVGALAAIARLAGTEVRYVKPHGALGNLAASDADVAAGVVDAVRTAFPALAILAISGTQLELVARAAGVEVYSEIFADRAYQPNGLLVPRSQPGAVIHDADRAAQRLIDFVEHGRMAVVGGDPIELAAHSICVHGDTPGAVEMARRIRSQLVHAGLEPRPFLPTTSPS